MLFNMVLKRNNYFLLVKEGGFNILLFLILFYKLNNMCFELFYNKIVFWN